MIAAKTSLASLAVLAMLALAATGCVDTRSQDLACGADDPCTVGRVCVEGFCVLASGDGDADAATDDASADGPIGTACTTMMGGVCTIDCGGGLACAERVVCPPGLECVVNCTGTGSCAAGIDCTAAVGRCDISCNGNGSCEGAIDCGTSRCDVTCTGSPSCTGGLDCSASCACDTMCTGTGACMPSPMCHPGNPCTQAGECSSGAGSCDDC